MPMDMINCKHCSTTINGNFCCNCGQPVQIKRVDSHYVLHEIQHILHFEKGILYTVKELLIRPEKSIKEFIADDRSRLVKPVVFIIITSLIYTITAHFFHIEKEYIEYSEAKSTTVGVIFGWVQSHYGYANIIMGLFIAFWLKIFFKKYGYNFFELLILLCFVVGMGMLIFTVFAVLQGITKIDLTKTSGIVEVCYCTWAIGQFFDKKKIGSYLKALAAFMLGIITVYITIGLLSAVIDSFVKS
jgi:hypothetical protein